MNDQWYVARRGPDGSKRYGPVPLAELRGLVDADRVRPDDLVWRDGMANWQPAGQCDDLFPPAPRYWEISRRSRLRNSPWRTIRIGKATCGRDGSRIAEHVESPHVILSRTLMKSGPVDRALGPTSLSFCATYHFGP